MFSVFFFSFWSRNALHLEWLMCLSDHHVSLLFRLLSILFSFISCCFSSLKNLFFGFLIEARYLLDLSRISGFSRYLSIDSPFHQSSSLNSLSTWYISRHLLDLSSQFCHQYLLHTSLIYRPLVLNTFLIYRGACFYIYLRFDPICFSLKYLDPFLFSLDPNNFSSKNSLYPSRFQPKPSFNPLVCALNLFFFSFLHAFHAFRPSF